MIDPHEGKYLDAQTNVDGASYAEWGGSDSFLMGRTYDSDEVAFSGWLFT